MPEIKKLLQSKGKNLKKKFYHYSPNKGLLFIVYKELKNLRLKAKKYKKMWANDMKSFFKEEIHMTIQCKKKWHTYSSSNDNFKHYYCNFCSEKYMFVAVSMEVRTGHQLFKAEDAIHLRFRSLRPWDGPDMKVSSIKMYSYGRRRTYFFMLPETTLCMFWMWQCQWTNY